MLKLTTKDQPDPLDRTVASKPGALRADVIHGLAPGLRAHKAHSRVIAHEDLSRRGGQDLIFGITRGKLFHKRDAGTTLGDDQVMWEGRVAAIGQRENRLERQLDRYVFRHIQEHAI